MPAMNENPDLEQALQSGRFVLNRPEGKGRQLRCTQCRSTGYAWGRWYDEHQKDHNFPCDTCGVSYLSNQALFTHYQKSRIHNPQ
jgi:hypothetical protein